MSTYPSPTLLNLTVNGTNTFANPLAISSGGTGASTASAALAALGGAPSSSLAAGGATDGASLVGYQNAIANAIATTVHAKLLERVDVVHDFGADPTGTTDSSTAFTNAFASARVVNIPVGTFICNAVNIPAGTIVRGAGQFETVIVPKTGTNPGTVFTVSGNGVEISDLQINASRTAFSTTAGIYASGIQFIYIHDVYMPHSGYIGIQTINCLDILVDHCNIQDPENICILHSGTSANRTLTSRNYVANSNGVGHGIQAMNGSNHQVLNNYIYTSPIFGVSIDGAFNCLVSGNTTYNTTHEGINVQDGSSVTVTDNNVSWDTTTSTDFGISIYGASAGGSNFHIVANNQISNCGKSGIAMGSSTGISDCNVHGNIIVNSNRLNLGTSGGGGGGVILYGSGAQNNRVAGNVIYDNINTLQFGIYEWNSGGAPSNNRFSDNAVTNAAQGALSISASSFDGLTATTATSYTPTVSAGTGTITTASATGTYLEIGKLVYVNIIVTITTNGTGASYVIATLPFTVGANASLLSGREPAVTNASLSATAVSGSNQLNIYKYDGTYPAANGSSLRISGFFIKQ